MTTTILVTAATSNIGREVVKQLAHQNVKVKAAVRSLSRGKDLPSNVELVEFDLNQPKTVEAAFVGVDKAFFMTPLVPNLVDLDTICLNAAKKAGVKQIVKLSIMGADTEPDMLLGNSHRESEKLIEASGIPYTFLRPNSFFQNYLIYTGETIKSQNAFFLPLGEGKLSLIDIRDVATVATVVLTENSHAGKAYQITGAEAIANAEVANILSQVLARDITYIDIPEATARQAMQENGIPDRQIDMVLGLYAQQKLGNYGGITSTFTNITGKKPISFEEFAQEYADVFT